MIHELITDIKVQCTSMRNWRYLNNVAAQFTYEDKRLGKELSLVCKTRYAGKKFPLGLNFAFTIT